MTELYLAFEKVHHIQSQILISLKYDSNTKIYIHFKCQVNPSAVTVRMLK